MKKVLITGGTGYLGSWIVKILLEKGYEVNLTVRDKSNTGKYQFLVDIANSSNGVLNVWEANLLKEGSYTEAMQGCDTVFHVASPFTLRYKDAQKELIDPALLGTRNILEAVNKVSTIKRVVLTSSVVAVHGDNVDMKNQDLSTFNEEHFNTSSSIDHQPYPYSKVLAEKEAWRIVESQNHWSLVTINPGFIMGPVLNTSSNSESIEFIRNMIGGKYSSGVPSLKMAYVDVRDVTEAHVFAAENERVSGRNLLVNKTYAVFEIAKKLEVLFPKKYKLPKMEAPKWLIYLIAPMFGVTREFIAKNAGYDIQFDNKKSVSQMGIKYRPIEDTLKSMVTSLG